jgi:hypothetical protein
MSRIDPGARPTSRANLPSWYAAALKAQAASGVSLTSFARRLGVSAWTLYQWRRRLLRRPRDGGPAARLVEVAIARPRPVDVVSSLVVHINDGRRRIEVPHGYDADDLRRVIAAIESC